MKKAIISTLAISLFALHMSLYAGPAKQDAAKKAVEKPLSAMKYTMASPSKSTPPAAKVSDLTTKASGKVSAIEEKTDSTQKMLEEAEKIGKNTSAGEKK